MLTMALSSAKNPDIRNGYWTPGRRPAPRTVEVESIAAAVKACGDYIARNDLGGGNWSGGSILRDGVEVARISYNGRVWEAKDEDAREIDPATGSVMKFGPCEKCGAEGYGTDVTAGGIVVRCLPHLRPWKFAKREAVRP